MRIKSTSLMTHSTDHRNFRTRVKKEPDSSSAKKELDHVLTTNQASLDLLSGRPMSAADVVKTDVITEESPKKGKLKNPDGTDMTVEDYQRAVR